MKNNRQQNMKSPGIWLTVAIASLGAVAGIGLVQKARLDQNYATVTGPRLCYPGAKLFTGTVQALAASRDKRVTEEELRRGGMMLVTPDSAQNAIAYYEREFGLQFELKQQSSRADRWSARAELPGFKGYVSVTGFKDEPTTLIGFAVPMKKKPGQP